MRKGILAIAAAGSIFALTAAGATGLGTISGAGSVAVTTSAAVSVTTTACTDAIAVAYTSADSNQSITGVVLTASNVASSDCVGRSATITLADATSSPAYTRVGTVNFNSNGVATLGAFTSGTGAEGHTFVLSAPYDNVFAKLAQTSISVV